MGRQMWHFMDENFNAYFSGFLKRTWSVLLLLDGECHQVPVYQLWISSSITID